VLRRVLLSAAANDRVRSLAANAPVARDVVRRFVAGEAADQALAVTRRLVDDGLAVSLDHLGEDTTDPGGGADQDVPHASRPAGRGRAGVGGRPATPGRWERCRFFDEGDTTAET
jgi:proline dehydrogenase